MTQPGEALDRVLGVLTNEGWAADPDATEYNLRVAALVLDAATPVAGGLDVEQLFSDLEMGLGDESHVAAVIAKYRAALAASQPVAEEGENLCGNCKHPNDIHSPVNAELCAVPDCSCPGFLTVAR